jgi:hypothetical protein
MISRLLQAVGGKSEQMLEAVANEVSFLRWEER